MLVGNDVEIKHSEEPEYWVKSNVWKDVLELADNPTFADFKIVAKDGTEVHCHKVVLAARSTVFKTMFEACDENMVGLQEMNRDVLKAFVDYMYGRTVKLTPPEMVRDLYGFPGSTSDFGRRKATNTSEVLKEQK